MGTAEGAVKDKARAGSKRSSTHRWSDDGYVGMNVRRSEGRNNGELSGRDKTGRGELGHRVTRGGNERQNENREDSSRGLPSQRHLP